MTHVPTRVLVALTVSLAAASGAWSQTPKPPISDAQAINVANQIANGTPRNPSGVIPMPSDVAHGMANVGFGSQTTIVNNANAPLNGGASVTDVGKTSFGALTIGVGTPMINSNQQLGGIIDEIEGKPGSQAYQAQQAQIRANQHTGPGYYTVDQATGAATWHPLPQSADYSAQDAYMQQYQANRDADGPPQVRDPFAQPANNAPTQPPPPPFVQPQLPAGPSYPTHQPKPMSTAQATAIAGALGAAMGAAAEAAAAEKEGAVSGDAAAVAAEAAGKAVLEAAQAIEAAGLGAEMGAILSQALDDGCASGACGAYLAHPYDSAKWQPMPMFTEANGSFTNNVSMTQVAMLLPIYKGYDPFAKGNLVPWPGEMMFPSLYPPTGVSSAGFPMDPAMVGHGYPYLAGQWLGPSDVMFSPDLYPPMLCGR